MDDLAAEGGESAATILAKIQMMQRLPNFSSAMPQTTESAGEPQAGGPGVIRSHSDSWIELNRMGES